jgi:cell division protein FtsI/penicillin-binding protein 2
MFAEPKKIKDSVDYSKQLASILFEYEEKPKNTTVIEEKGLRAKLEEDLKKTMDQNERYWVVLKKKIPQEAKDRIDDLGLLGIGFEEEPERYYPEGTLGAQILGYIAGSDTGEEQGYFGIEGFLNGDLRGKAGKVLEEKSASGQTILLGGYRKIPPQNGRDIILTLNREVQFLVEQKLKEGVEKFDAESGSVIIMNPVSGDIIAMANYPSFDPSNPFYDPQAEKNKKTEETEEGAGTEGDLDSENKVVGAEDKKEASKSAKVQRRNVAISDVYEPGSIIKPLTVATAVELKMVDKDTTFNDEGVVYYSGHKIDNWNGKHLGVQTVAQLLEKSNNIGAAWVGLKVGAKELYSSFKRFGLGENTGVMLEGETTGILRDPKDWKDIDIATASFGQGISVSLAQVAQAFSVFDNGGILVEPKIVDEIISQDRRIEFEPKQRRRVISKETADAMREMLVMAVDNGESKYFNLKGYTIAGKTGTAQIPVDGKYLPDKTNTTFVGFLPKVSQDKKFVMVVKLEKPTSSIYAAETAVPLWMEILKNLVPIYKIAPDRPID